MGSSIQSYLSGHSRSLYTIRAKDDRLVHLHHFALLPGTFLVGVDVDGTLEMRPGPIAREFLGQVKDALQSQDLIDFALLLRLRYLKSWFFPDLLILIIDIVLFIMTSKLAPESLFADYCCGMLLPFGNIACHCPPVAQSLDGIGFISSSTSDGIACEASAMLGCGVLHTCSMYVDDRNLV